MAVSKNWYEVRASNNIKPGHKITIDHSIALDKSADISNLTSLPFDELNRRREESVILEKAIFEQLVKSVSKWAEQAAVTRLLDKAMEYIKILFASWDGNGFILLHHFVKKTQKTPDREIKQAQRNLKDYQERGKDNE